MGSESVASCRQPSPASPGSPLLNKAQNVQNNTFERIPNKGACFFCHEEGHWVRDCPSRSNPTPGSGSPTAGRRSYQELQCPCGYGACIVLTSRTAKNPGRDFYRCPGKQGQGACNHFQWYDSPMNANLLSQDNKDACEAINIVKTEDTVAPVSSPILQEQASNRERELKNQGAYKTEHYDHLLNKTDPPTLDNKQACKAINFSEAKDTVAPVSPLLKQDQRDAFLQISPVKRLSLEDGSPDAGSSKLKRCLKFGGEGHWLNEHEHSASPSSPCIKCGRFAQHSSG